MSDKISLKDLERNLFRESIQDGIIDIQIGCVINVCDRSPSQ